MNWLARAQSCDNYKSGGNNLDWCVLLARAASVVRGYFLTLSRALAGQPSRSSQDRRLESSQPVGLRTEKQETGPSQGFQVIIIVWPAVLLRFVIMMINVLFWPCMTLSTICVGRENTKLLIDGDQFCSVNKS